MFSLASVKKVALPAVGAVALAGALSLAATPAAQARDGDIVAGAVGGFLLGSVLGATAGPPPVYYAPGPVYYGPPPPAYYAPPPPPPRYCHTEQERVWTGYAWAYRPVSVCD